MTSKKIISFLLFLYVLSILIFDNIRYVKLVYIFDAMMVGYYLIYKLLVKKLNFEVNSTLFFLFLFTFLCICSLFWVPDISTAFTRVLSLIFICINTFIIYNILKEFDNLNYIFYSFFTFIVYNFLILNNLFGFKDYYYVAYRFQGTTENPNLVAIYSIFAIFISIYLLIKEESNKILIIFLYLILLQSLILIIYTGSKKGIIFSLLLLFGYLIIYMRPSKQLLKRIIILCIILFSITYVAINFLDLNGISENIERIYKRIEGMLFTIDNVNFVDSSTKHRIHLINSALEKFYENPLLGLGITGFQYYEGVYAHNNYAEILANLGFVGFIIYYSIYISVIIKVFALKIKIIKIFFLLTLFTMLIMDVGLVSYFSKIYFIILISIYYLSMQLQKGKL